MTTARLVALLLGTLMVGCAGLPRAPRHPMDDKEFAAPLLAKYPGLPGDRPPSLVLLPGDKIDIELSSNTTTSMKAVLVESAGTVHLPLAGDVEVVGLSLVGAEAKLKSAMQRYDTLVHVTVAISSLEGHKVTVAGAVKTPGVIQLQPAARLADVIMAAGGAITSLVNGQIVDGADLVNARLVRDGVVVPVDFSRALMGQPLHNVYARAGDQVYIPSGQGLSVSVMGQTGGRVMQWAPGFRLTQALAFAGGINVGGDKNDIRIVRGSIDQPRVYKTSIRDVIDGNGHDVELYPGDLVFVTDHWIEDFGEVFTVLTPFLSLSVSISALALALRATNN